METATKVNDVDVFNWFRTESTDKVQMMLSLVASLTVEPPKVAEKSRIHRGRKPGSKNKARTVAQDVLQVTEALDSASF